MFYFKNIWRSVREKPMIYCIYILTMAVCVVVSCVFYRLTKQQIAYLDFDAQQVDYSLLAPIGMGILIMAIAGVNVLVAYNYISSKNIHNILLYKMVGAKNVKIIAAMTFETLLMLAIAYFSAIAIEYPIVKPLLNFSFAELTVLDYFYIFLINLLSVILILGVRIIKVSCSSVTVNSINGGQK